MAGFSYHCLLAAVLALLVGQGDGAQTSRSAWTFLDRVGGSVDPGVLWPGAAPDEPAALFATSLTYQRHVIAQRFYSDGGVVRPLLPMVVAEFDRDCLGARGTMAGSLSAVAEAVTKWAQLQLDQHRSIYPWEYYRWVKVCLGRDREPLATLVAVQSFNRPNSTRDHTVPGGLLFGPKQESRLALYALSSEMFRRDPEYLALLEPLRRNELARKLIDWRADMTIGTRTNCGTVIQERGPLVEVQIPAGIKGPGGARQFWVARDQLTDDEAPRGCGFGL